MKQAAALKGLYSRWILFQVSESSHSKELETKSVVYDNRISTYLTEKWAKNEFSGSFIYKT